MSDTQNALPIGTVLHGQLDYRIEKVLGSGGFGITYLASATLVFGNLSTEVNVAIKEHFMRDNCARNSDATTVITVGNDSRQLEVANSRKDFIAEARRMAELSQYNRHIVKVNEVFEANNTAYYVMEYLEGQSLHSYIQEHGPLDSNSIRKFIFPIIEAVGTMHSNRFTHLDIKPANIMLQFIPGGVRPVLIDFGLSKHYDANGKATSTVNTFAASDGFAPIEQYVGLRTFSPAADVYAIGATIYAAATGNNPPVAGSWSPGQPAATIAGLNLDPAIATATVKALSQNASDRFPDARAFFSSVDDNEIEVKSDFSQSATRPFRSVDTQRIETPTPVQVPIQQPAIPPAVTYPYGSSQEKDNNITTPSKGINSIAQIFRSRPLGANIIMSLMLAIALWLFIVSALDIAYRSIGMVTVFLFVALGWTLVETAFMTFKNRRYFMTPFLIVSCCLILPTPYLLLTILPYIICLIASYYSEKEHKSFYCGIAEFFSRTKTIWAKRRLFINILSLLAVFCIFPIWCYLFLASSYVDPGINSTDICGFFSIYSLVIGFFYSQLLLCSGKRVGFIYLIISPLFFIYWIFCDVNLLSVVSIIVFTTALICLTEYFLLRIKKNGVSAWSVMD